MEKGINLDEAKKTIIKIDSVNNYIKSNLNLIKSTISDCDDFYNSEYNRNLLKNKNSRILSNFNKLLLVSKNDIFVLNRNINIYTNASNNITEMLRSIK